MFILTIDLECAGQDYRGRLTDRRLTVFSQSTLLIALRCLIRRCEKQSVFGYCAVLPGAFSAYRWVALQDDVATGKGPLASYFKGEVLHGRNADMFTANMYLAEDR